MNNSLDEHFIKKEISISPFTWWEAKRKTFNSSILPYPFIIGCLIDIFFIKAKFEGAFHIGWIGTGIGTFIGIFLVANVLFSIPELCEIIYKSIHKKVFSNRLRVIFEKIIILITIIITLTFFLTP